MYKVGLQYVGYPEKRNIIDKVDKATYYQFSRKESIVSRIINKVKRELKIKRPKEILSTREIHSFRPDYNKEIDFYHLFNSISYGKNIWGVSFERIVPCHDEDEDKIVDFLRGKLVSFESEKFVKKLDDSKCKFLIALSECSFNLQIEYLNYFPSYKRNILSKMHILHPPQKVLIDIYEKPNISNGVNFMFIGNEFFRKGGIEILRVFEKIKNVYPNFKLTMIGDCEKSDGRFFLSEGEQDELQAVVKNNDKRISYFKTLSNAKVLKMMVEDIHVGLLPTHADTYGYSVLEFQAAGCPVITTNSRALLEINNDDCGWLIDVPQSTLREPIANSDSELILIQNIIEKQLLNIMTEILENPSIIKPKALNSIKRIKEQHNPDVYSNKLSEIYESSCG